MVFDALRRHSNDDDQVDGLPKQRQPALRREQMRLAQDKGLERVRCQHRDADVFGCRQIRQMWCIRAR